MFFHLTEKHQTQQNWGVGGCMFGIWRAGKMILPEKRKNADQEKNYKIVSTGLQLQGKRQKNANKCHNEHQLIYKKILSSWMFTILIFKFFQACLEKGKGILGKCMKVDGIKHLFVSIFYKQTYQIGPAIYSQ